MQPKGEGGAVPVEDVAASLGGELLIGSSFQDCKTVFITPTRPHGGIQSEVVESWLGLMSIPNQGRHWLFVKGHEVGEAYETAIDAVLAHPVLKDYPYIMTLEDDNIPPPPAWPRLLHSLVKFGLDGVSGFYRMKGEDGWPLIMGNPREFERTGVLDFAFQDPLEVLKLGNVVEVNAVPMGCAVFKTELFRELPKPWFQTTALYDDRNSQPWYYTHDNYFCHHARLRGKRFAVDMRVQVGHLDIGTGVIW